PRPPSRTVVIACISAGLGVALARAYAKPGTRLCLLGSPARTLNQTAEDCRRRGASVEVFGAGGAGGGGAASACDYPTTLAAAAPVDTLVVNGDLVDQPVALFLGADDIGAATDP